MKHKQSDLGELEREVMHLVWKHDGITAEAIREQLNRSLKESTVRTVLRRLEGKGYVKHTTDGRTFIYSHTESRKHVAAKAVKRVVDWFCNGSIEDVLVGMVDADIVDRRELLKLVSRVAKKKTEKK